MKCLVFTYENYSHNKSIINFINELSASRSCKVYLFANNKFKYLYNNSNIEFIPYPKDILASLDNIFIAYEKLDKPIFKDTLEEIGFRSVFNTEYAINACLLYVSALIDIVKEINPDVIIRDSCAIYGKFIGDSLSIPVVGYITNLVYTSDFIKSDIVKNFSDVLGINLSDFSKEEVLEMYKLFEKSVKSICDKYKISSIVPLFTLDPNEKFNIIFSSKLLQPELITSSDAIYKIAKPSVFHNNNEDVSLPKKEKLIYVSTGSILNPPVEFLNSVIGAFKDSEYKVIISFPGADNPGLRYKLPENIKVEKFVDQESILKKACLFITHGGYNSLCESIYNLVPMLVYPLSNDQYLNASLIEKLKVGIDLRKYNLTSKAIYMLSKKVIENQSLLSNLIDLKMSFNETSSYSEIINSLNNIYNHKLLND